MKSTRRSPASPSDKTPVFRKIYARMRDAILNGDMQPGTRVPSWSDLAGELNVSRGTVKAAYDCLTGEGFLISRGAAGTVVNPELASISQAKRSASLGQRTLHTTLPPPDAFGLTLANDESLPFQMGVPAFDVFPRALWARLIARRARALSSHNMGHLPAAGDLPLRAAIASYLAVARGLNCNAEQIFITTGYKGALHLIAQALLKAGDAVLLEDPGYPLARLAMEMMGARVVAAPVDEEGVNLDRLSPRNSKAKLAIVTPSHHAPLGMPLSLPRRLALLEWAARQSAWIIEDDYYGEFRLQSRPLPALASLDQQRVLYTGTFSKVLLPSLRLGYVVVPNSLRAAFTRVTNFLAPSPAPLLQGATADFMQQGYFARHVRRMASVYSERRVAMIKALQTHVGDQVKFHASALHIVLSLPKRSDDVRIAASAMQQRLAPGPLTPWFINASREPGLLLSFANVPVKEANRRIKQLAEVIAASSKVIRRG